MVALLVGVVLSCGSLSDDELNCEEAVSKLENCCSKLEAHRFTCERTCSGTVDFTEKAATCVQDRSCSDLQDRGICTAMLRLSNENPSLSIGEVERAACK